MAAPVVYLRLPHYEFETATLFGIVYVLEGSRLGARVLLRYVLASNDPIFTENVRYLQHGVSEHEGALLAFSAFEQALHKASGPVGARVPRG